MRQSENCLFFQSGSHFRGEIVPLRFYCIIACELCERIKSWGLSFLCATPNPFLMY